MTLNKDEAQMWEENELGLVLKALTESIRNKDKERETALKQSLLTLGKKSSTNPFGIEENCYIPQRSKTMHARFSSPSKLNSNNSEITVSTSADSVEEKKYLEKIIEQNTKQYDLQIMLMLVGDSDTGKSCLLNKFIDGKFNSSPSKTRV